MVVAALLDEDDVVVAAFDELELVVVAALELELAEVALPEEELLAKLDDVLVVFKAAAAAALELEAAAALELEAAAFLELAVEATLLNSPGVEASMKTVINRREIKMIGAVFMMRTIRRITYYLL